jgi:type IV pilus assembly protein PilC
MKFTYKAIDTHSTTSTGVIEAASTKEVTAHLTKKGLKPLLIQSPEKQSPKKSLTLPFLKPKVKSREMLVFTRQLSTLVSAGVPLTRSLNTLAGQAETETFKKVILGITKDVEAGQSLGDAFAKYPNIFSEVYINMVRAGEAGGILDEILKRVANQTEKDASIKKKVKGAMTYPVVVFCIAIAAFFGLMIFIVPKIGKILKDLGGPDAQLPIYTQIMLSISDFCISNSIMAHIPVLSAIPLLNKLPNVVFIFAAMFIAGIYLLRYIRTPKGKYKFHSLLLRIPVVKVLIVKVAISRFARTFSALTAAGVSVLDALEVTGGAIGNKVIEEELKNAANDVKNGKPLSEPISQSQYFPPIVAQMLAVGEETGQMDTILVKVADFYDEEVDTVIDNLSSVIEPVMIIFMGSLVGLIAASVMGPIASLSQNAGEG